VPPEQLEWLRQQSLNLRIEVIHSGFVTIKHKGELYHNATPHIDSVIAFIPGELSRNGRGKLLVDPQYLNFAGDRLRLFAEQEDLEIVTVAENELHLQMTNCVVINGQLIINNGPETIKKLKLKEGVAIYPDIPNTELVWAGGLYRCLSNVLPESLLANLMTQDLDVSLDPEELVRSLHLQAFCGQEPGRDVTEELARVVAEQGYDQKTIFRALVKFANDTDGQPPTWWGINALVEMLAEEARILAEAV